MARAKGATIRVEPGMVLEDNDYRCPDRRLRVTRVDARYVYCDESAPPVRIQIKRITEVKRKSGFTLLPDASEPCVAVNPPNTGVS